MQAKGTKELCHGKGVLVVVHDEMYRHTTFASTGTLPLVPSDGSRMPETKHRSQITTHWVRYYWQSDNSCLSSPLPVVSQPHPLVLGIGRR